MQWGIRLLVTWQSRLLELPDIRAVIGDFDAHTLTYPWRHPDPRVDALQAHLLAMVGVRVNRPRHETFQAIRAAVDEARGGTGDAAVRPGGSRACARHHSVPERALVLLSGTQRRAGGSVVNANAARRRRGRDACC